MAENAPARAEGDGRWQMTGKLKAALVAVVATLSAGNVAAQSIGAGLKLGWTTSHLEVDPYSSGHVQSLMAGGFLDVRLNRFLALQPEVDVVRKGTSSDLSAGSSSNGQPMVWEPVHVATKYGYVEMPLLLRLEVPVSGRLRPYVAAGPYLGIRSWCDVASSSSAVRPTCGVSAMGGSERRLDTGAVVAGGVRLHVADRYWLATDARYEMGKRSIFTPVLLSPVLNRSLVFSLGITRQPRARG